MLQVFFSHAGGLNDYVEVGLQIFLSDKFGKALRPQVSFQGFLFRSFSRGKQGVRFYFARAYHGWLVLALLAGTEEFAGGGGAGVELGWVGVVGVPAGTNCSCLWNRAGGW